VTTSSYAEDRGILGEPKKATLTFEIFGKVKMFDIPEANFLAISENSKKFISCFPVSFFGEFFDDYL